MRRRSGKCATSCKGTGFDLVVALVPAKARVYPDKLGRYALPAGQAGRYRQVLALLAGLDLPAPDLLAPLSAARRSGEVFLRNDTHWTPLGAGAAAEALAPAVSGLLQEAGSPRARFISSDGPPREYRGDLLNFLPLGPFQERLGPRPDVVSPRLTAAAEPPGGLFDRPAIPVVLAGTSYSAGELWNLEGALKTAVAGRRAERRRGGPGSAGPDEGPAVRLGAGRGRGGRRGLGDPRALFRAALSGRWPPSLAAPASASLP